jgi:hypothetical protein
MIPARLKSRQGDAAILFALLFAVVAMLLVSMSGLRTNQTVRQQQAVLTDEGAFYAGELVALSAYFTAQNREQFDQGIFPVSFPHELGAKVYRYRGNNADYLHSVDDTNGRPTYCGTLEIGDRPQGVCLTHQCSMGTDNNDTETFGGSPFSLASDIASRIASRRLPFRGMRAGLPIVRSRGTSGGGNDWDDDSGTPERDALDAICGLFEYRAYVSSTCRDTERSGRYPNGKCNFHSPGDNEHQSLNAVTGRFTVEGADPKYEKTWLSSITCVGKITCPASARRPSGSRPCSGAGLPGFHRHCGP